MTHALGLLLSPASTSPSNGAAEFPFNQPSADIILRSSDHVDFHVHHSILAQASHIFADMLSIPQPQNEERIRNQCLPDVDLVEDSKTLRRLLLLCYPVNKPELEPLEDIVPVLRAATKYVMEWPITLITRNLLSLVPSKPFRVWAVACEAGLDTVAQQAAQQLVVATQATSSNDKRAPFRTERDLLKGVSAGDYFRLLALLHLSFPYRNCPLRSLSPVSSSLPSKYHEPSPLHFIPYDPAPDVTLLCADGVEISAHRLILTLCIPKLLESLKNGSPLPVLSVDAKSYILIDLLHVCYKGSDNLPFDASGLAAFWMTSKRYDAHSLCKAARRRWDSVATLRPIEAYFAAIHNELGEQIVHDAAKRTLASIMTGVYAPSMEHCTAQAYDRLLDYHSECARAVSEELQRVSMYVADMATPPCRKPFERREGETAWAALAWLQGRLAKAFHDVADGARAPARILVDFEASALLVAAARERKTSAQPDDSWNSVDFSTFVRIVLEVEGALRAGVESAISSVSVRGSVPR